MDGRILIVAGYEFHFMLYFGRIGQASSEIQGHPSFYILRGVKKEFEWFGGII